MKFSFIGFSVENFKIFKDKVDFSMATRKSHHTFDSNGEHLLKTSMIYGPNASGKSTLLDALELMLGGIKHSANPVDSKQGENLPYDPFRLSEETINKPTTFEVTFSLDDAIYRYNFSFSKNQIESENFFEVLKNGKEKKHLNRTQQKFTLHGVFKQEADIVKKTRKDSLFISVAAQWNSKFAEKILQGFNQVSVISGPESEKYNSFTVKEFGANEDMKKLIIKYLRTADFCISGGESRKKDIPKEVLEQLTKLNLKNIPEQINDVAFYHDKFDLNEKVVGYEKIGLLEESTGTQKFFSILGPVLDTLEDGRVLFVDEFDNSLHPLLTKLILDLFEKKNPNNAQLIVTTHDTSLLTYRDDFDKVQFWFTEKDRFGRGKLFSLAEFNLRNDTEYEKKYLEGRFGALPFIESIE